MSRIFSAASNGLLAVTLLSACQRDEKEITALKEYDRLFLLSQGAWYAANCSKVISDKNGDRHEAIRRKLVAIYGAKAVSIYPSVITHGECRTDPNYPHFQSRFDDAAGVLEKRIGSKH